MKFGVRPRYNPETPSFLKISLMSDVMVLGCAEMVPLELAVITRQQLIQTALNNNLSMSINLQNEQSKLLTLCL